MKLKFAACVASGSMALRRNSRSSSSSALAKTSAAASFSTAARTSAANVNFLRILKISPQ